jgi:hypothetical protein
VAQHSGPSLQVPYVGNDNASDLACWVVLDFPCRHCYGSPICVAMGQYITVDPQVDVAMQVRAPITSHMHLLHLS